MIWAWCVKESEPRRWVQEASSGSKPDPDGRSGPGAKQNRSRFIRLASGCEASHDLVDAVRVVHRLHGLFSLRVPEDVAEMQRQIRTHREGSGNQREAGGIRANHNWVN